MGADGATPPDYGTSGAARFPRDLKGLPAPAAARDLYDRPVNGAALPAHRIIVGFELALKLERRVPGFRAKRREADVPLLDFAPQAEGDE